MALSLLAGIDPAAGKADPRVKERPRLREFIEFLNLLDAAYPAAKRDQVDPRQPFCPHLQRNQGVARDPARWPLQLRVHPGTRLLAQPGRGLVFQAALRGSRHIRAVSKQALEDRILAAIGGINRQPAVPTWSGKLDEAA